MPYTVPTLAQFQDRFTEFEALDDEVVEAAIEDASGQVDETWIEADYQLAILLLAAHYVQVVGGAYDTGGLRSVSLGSISVTYADGSSKSFSSSATSYGQRFQQLLRANKRGPRVV